MFLISFYSFNIYNFYYKKPSAFIEKLIHTKDKENLNEYVNKVLSQKENSEIFDFFDKENFKYYKNNGNTYFYFKGVILGKRYSIKIELNDNNVVKNIYIFTGYNAYQKGFIMATERIEIGYEPLSNIDYPKIPSFFLFIRI